MYRRQFREHVEVGGAREAVGAHRNRDAGLVERLNRRGAGAAVAVTARAGDERDAPSGESRQIRGRHLHAMDGDGARVEKPRLVQILHRAHTRRDPLRVPCANLLQQDPPRSRRGPDEFDFLGRFAEVHAARCEAVAVDRPSNRA